MIGELFGCMADPSEIADAIDSGGIIDYDGNLCVKFMGKQHPDIHYSVDENWIQFPCRRTVLTDWLRGLPKNDDLWSVVWANK